MPSGSRRAVVIGLNEYADRERIPSLHGAVNDATEIYRNLTLFGDFEVAVPALTMQEALRNDHLTDLGITMFVRVRLYRRRALRAIYGLFVLFQFHDYGHLRSKRALLRWGRAILRDLLPPRLAPPDRS